MASSSARSPYSLATREPLVKFFIFSVLLHILIIMLFGDTDDGGVMRAAKLWGSLAVNLGEAKQGSRMDAKSDRPTELDSRALSHRTEPRAESSITESTQPLETMPPIVTETPQTLSDIAPRFEPSKTQEPTPFAVTVPVEREPTPVESSPALDKLIPPKLTSELAPAVELPTPQSPLEPLPRIASPKLGSELAPPAQLPSQQPVELKPLERIAPSKFASELAPPADLPPPDLPAELLPMQRVAPAKLATELAPPVQTTPPEPEQAVEFKPLERVVPAKLASELAPAAEIAPQPTIRQEAVSAPPASRIERAPESQPGAPRGEDTFSKPRSIDSATESKTLPSIDREAARSRARELARSSSRGLLPAPALPEERKSKEALAIEKALKADCRTAYAHLGLLAVAPLVWDSIAEGKCKW